MRNGNSHITCSPGTRESHRHGRGDVLNEEGHSANGSGKDRGWAVRAAIHCDVTSSSFREIAQGPGNFCSRVFAQEPGGRTGAFVGAVFPPTPVPRLSGDWNANLRNPRKRRNKGNVRTPYIDAVTYRLLDIFENCPCWHPYRCPTVHVGIPVHAPSRKMSVNVFSPVHVQPALPVAHKPPALNSRVLG
jgi:hypothetical protein